MTAPINNIPAMPQPLPLTQTFTTKSDMDTLWPHVIDLYKVIQAQSAYIAELVTYTQSLEDRIAALE